tara:strand:- start:504 stop:740 length:237 start_codon:yes stop_codon:yes gene_type:complete
MTTHIYTHWLANNFTEYINTNPFAPEYEDDIHIIMNDYDEYVIFPEPPLYIPDDEDYTLPYDDDLDDEFNIINTWLFD